MHDGHRAQGVSVVARGKSLNGGLNARLKYVASNTLTDPQGADTTVLSGDVAAAVRELKAKLGGELQVHGSGTLVRWLLDNQLVDEITLLVCPVVVGQGRRMFPDNDPDMAPRLVESRAFPRHHAPGLPAGRAPAVRNRLMPPRGRIVHSRRT
jgi:dihydrofolate reductase